MPIKLKFLAASCKLFSLPLAQTVLALLLLAGPPSVMGANLVKVTAVIYEYGNTRYPNARAACIAAIRDIQGPESKRYKVISGEPEDSPGPSVGIRCTFEDTDQNGSRDSSALGASSLVCPEHSSPFNYKDKTCECDTRFVARGAACVDATQASQTANPTAEAAKTDAPNCELDRLKGAALKNAVVKLVDTYTIDSNKALIDNPVESAKSVPSVGRGFFLGDYGTLLESLVAKRVEADACLSKFIRHLSSTEQSQPGPEGEKGVHPDFRGVVKALKDLQIDITTEGEKAKKKWKGGKDDYVFIVYERGLCFDSKTREAVRIPKNADRSKILKGVCPPRW